MSSADAVTAPDELSRLDAMGQAELVERGEISAKELAEAAIRRIEAGNEKLQAVVTPLFERGLQRAGGALPRGPLSGVPVLLKATIPWAGAPLTFGCRFFQANVALDSHEVTERFEAAGMVPLGLTNASEFGLLPVTEPALHEPARNPWSPERSPGGSSGGSAAAVAAGFVPLAQGSDGGGSVRIPASCCGLFGLKPSRGRHPERPYPESLGLSVVHGLTRSVRDSAALLDVTRGSVHGDRWVAPRPGKAYLREIGTRPKKLRIAVCREDFFGRRAHPDCVDAVEATAGLCRELGHTVEEAAPSLDARGFFDGFVLLWAAGAAKVVRAVERALGEEPDRSLFEPWTWALVDHARQHLAADLLLAQDALQRVAWELGRFQEDWDLLLTPVLASPPWRVGELDQGQPFEALREQLSRYVAFTPLANATGQPAMSVPLHESPSGLPIGSHFHGRFGEETTLLRLAAQLEEARPWAGRWPRGF